MMAIKLSPRKHAAVSGVLKKLTWLGYIAGMVFVTYSGIQGYLFASEILANHKVVSAPLAYEGTTIEHQERHDVVSYHFRYYFMVDGVKYEKAFTTSVSSAEALLDKVSVQVAYRADNPRLNERLDKLQRDSDPMSWAKRLLMSIPLFGLLAFVVYLLLTRRLFVATARA